MGCDHHPAWGLVITGGRHHSTYFKSVLVTRDGNTFEEEKEMPFMAAHHCSVIADSDTLVVLGGVPDLYRTAMFTRSNRCMIVCIQFNFASCERVSI